MLRFHWACRVKRIRSHCESFRYLRQRHMRCYWLPFVRTRPLSMPLIESNHIVTAKFIFIMKQTLQFSTGSQEILLPIHTTSQSTPKREGPYSQLPHSKSPWWRRTTAFSGAYLRMSKVRQMQKINLRSYLISHAFRRFQFPQGTLMSISSIHWSHPPQSCPQRVWIFILKTFRYSEISASLLKSSQRVSLLRKGHNTRKRTFIST